MSCEEHRQRLSLMMDGEGEGTEQAGLFAHLEGCAGCRQFLDSLIQFRKAARRDRQEILREAAEVIPERAPLPATVGRAAGGSRAARPRGWGGWLRPSLPAPAALALAVLLLAAGIAIGVGLGARRNPARLAPNVETTTSPSTAPTVIYVCSMPEVKVSAPAIPSNEH